MMSPSQVFFSRSQTGRKEELRRKKKKTQGTKQAREIKSSSRGFRRSSFAVECAVGGTGRGKAMESENGEEV